MPKLMTRKCARDGTLEAKRIRICVFEVDDDNGTEVELACRTFKPATFEEDLSDQAIHNLLAKIDRAIKPPVKREKAPKPPEEGDGDE